MLRGNLLIDIEQSLRRRKLIYRRDFNDWFNLIFLYLFPFVIIVTSSVALSRAFYLPPGSEKFFIYFFCVLAILFSIYLSFMSLTMTKLKTIPTKSNENENRKMIFEYAKEKEFKVTEPSPNCVVFSGGDWIGTNPRFFVFLFSGENIFYCGFISSWRLGDAPSLYQYWIILDDLRKIIKKRDQ